MTMDIRAEPGSRIKFVYPDNGYSVHQATAKQYLRPDHVYTVELVDVSAYHTDVFLVEVPGVSFNSVLFEDYNEISTTEIPYRIRKAVPR